MRDNDEATIIPTPRHQASHPDCRCLLIQFVALQLGLLAQQAPLGLVEALAQRRDHLRRLLLAVLVARRRQIAEAEKAGEPPLRSLRGQAAELVVAGFGTCAGVLSRPHGRFLRLHLVAALP